MSMQRYMSLMLKSLSGRGSLFLFVRTHHHLSYYFNLTDTRQAANQNGARPALKTIGRGKVVQIRPLSRALASQPQ